MMMLELLLLLLNCSNITRLYLRLIARNGSSRVFSDNLVGLDFLSVPYINQSQLTTNYLLWEKVDKMPLLQLRLFFLGSG